MVIIIMSQKKKMESMADGQCEELRVWKLELGPNLDLFGII